MPGQAGVGEDRNQRKQAQADWGSAGNGLGRPLALGFAAEGLSDMAKGRFHLPTALEEDQTVERVKGQVGTQQGLGGEFTFDIANQDTANRHRRFAVVKPHGLMGADFNVAQLVVVPQEGQARPSGGWVINHLLRCGQALAFLARATFAAVGGGRFVPGGIQSQARNDGDGVGQSLASVQKLQRGIAAIRHKNQTALGQPTPNLIHQLARPVRDGLGLSAPLRVVAFRGRQCGQERQRPDALGKRNARQPHHAYPTQPAGLDKVTLAGPHPVSVDPFGCNFLAASPLDRFIDPQHQWPPHIQDLQQQAQQYRADFQPRPHRPRQNMVLHRVVAFLAQPHHPQYRAHRALPSRQYRARHQHFDLVPRTDPVDGWRKFAQNRYHPYRQINHLQPFPQVRSRCVILPHLFIRP